MLSGFGEPQNIPGGSWVRFVVKFLIVGAVVLGLLLSNVEEKRVSKVKADYID